jgi:dihydroorotate dehydrogenase electron transfer subunit
VASITVREGVSSVGARSTESSPEPFTPSVASELATVIANAPVNAEYRHLVIACSETAAAGAPNQFFQLLCPQSGASGRICDAR